MSPHALIERSIDRLDTVIFVSDEPWLNEQEERVWRTYLAVHVKLTARMNRQLQRDSGLSGADYEVLVNLSEAPDHRVRSFELVASMQWEKSRLSHHLTRMQQRGLVLREECSTDGRGAFIVLTPQGQTAIETAAPPHVAEVRAAFFDALTPQQLKALGTITGTILEHLQASE
jgi:DNA-binding MarR family transcriptional regulator